MKNQRVVLGGLITSILFAGSFVFAAVTSGAFTWNSSTDVTITQLSISKPSSAEGDFMLANVSVNGGSAATITPPAGWTLILRTDNDTDVGVATYYKFAGASEPSTYLWSVSPQTTAVGAITVYSGVADDGPIDVVAGNNGRGTVATTSPVTTSSPNSQIVTLFATDAGKANEAGVYFTQPVGTTEKYDVTNVPYGPSTAADEVVQVTPGIVSSFSSTISGNKQRNWVSQVIALREDAPSTFLDGLTHYWKLDESSGDALDSVGGMTMTNVNSTVFSPGKILNGIDIEFDSASTLTSDTALQAEPFTAYSVCAWLRPESQPSFNDSYVFFTSYDEPGTWDMRYINISGTMHIKVNHFTAEDPSLELVHPVVLPTGEWNHMCATWNGTHVQMHLNGTPIGPAGAANNVRYLESSGTFIGSQSSLQQWDGLIDEVGVWNRALTVSEISDLYNGGAGRTYPF